MAKTPNMRRQVKGDTVTFYYVFPDGRWRSLGRNYRKAVATAKELNAKLAASNGPRPTANDPDISTLVEQFLTHVAPQRRWAERTRKETAYRLRAFARAMRHKTAASLTTSDIAAYLNERPGDAYKQHRLRIKELMNWACHQGYRTDNPALVTMEPIKQERRRQRHTWEGFSMILDAAPPFLNRAMRLALFSLQRRADVVDLCVDSVDLDANTFTVLQQKTVNYAEPVYIEIMMSPDLRAVVEECLTDRLPGPHLIQRRPHRLQGRGTGREPFAVGREYLTRTFKRVRDACGAYDHLPMNERPTFHDTRPLGIWLYRKAGYPADYINALSGHAGMRMQNYYASGHEPPAAKPVQAGLTLDRILRVVGTNTDSGK